MQIGVITVDGRQVGVVAWSYGYEVDPFAPDLDGYVPEGRAAETPLGLSKDGTGHHVGHGSAHGPSHHAKTRMRFGGEGDLDPLVERRGHATRGNAYVSDGRGHPVAQGSTEVDRAIVDAARAHHLDINTMRSIASIESGMNPASNAHRATQYKGLYQIGHDEWRRFGDGNIYDARANAFAAARMFEANRSQFRNLYGRDPTDTELYMMHQQGLGFYTRGAMTNIPGNPYPGMHGPQSHESFEAGWGAEVARRKAQFAASHSQVAEEAPPADVHFDPETMAP